MRGKVAKRLRREAREVCEQQGFTAEREIQEINHHPKLYRWLAKSVPDGKGGQRVIDNGVRMVHQEVNNPKSVRGLYRLLKAHYKGKIA